MAQASCSAMGELYSQYEYWVAAAQLLLAMLGMGATLRIRDFTEVARRWIRVHRA